MCFSVNCQTCGGTGHDEADCSERPTAIMDFLRESNYEERGSDSITGAQWKPSGDVVLGVEALTAQALAESATSSPESPEWESDRAIEVIAYTWDEPDVARAVLSHPSNMSPTAPVSDPPTKVVEVHLSALIPAVMVVLLVIVGIAAIALN
jgi:hypothetical protein